MLIIIFLIDILNQLLNFIKKKISDVTIVVKDTKEK